MAIIAEGVNNALVVYESDYTHSLREYYLHVVRLFMTALQDSDVGVNVVFGDIDADMPNCNPVKRIAFQYEHTLVKPGGRDADGFPVGQVPIFGTDDSYLVRLVNYEQLKQADVIIEYSRPNMMNVCTGGDYHAYPSRAIYVSPSLYGLHLDRGQRDVGIMTNFYDVSQPRRARLLTEAARRNMGLHNFTGHYGDRLKDLYRNCKILVNLHQTDHHDTLEEMRVLPALRSGCIIVSEDAAARSLVPYHEHIIWANADNILDVVQDVAANYDRYHEQIFGGEVYSQLRGMEIRNIDAVLGVLQQWS